MNEAGLVASGMQLSVTGCPAADERYPVSSPTWTQYVLDTCATVDEVIAAQDSLRLRGDAVHFLVADSTGACEHGQVSQWGGEFRCSAESERDVDQRQCGEGEPARRGTADDPSEGSGRARARGGGVGQR